MHFTSEYRVVIHTFDLCFLDFAIPIRTFHKTDHEALLAALSKIDNIINHEETAFLVRLNHEANAFPVCKFWFEAKTFK
ncbi:hypothetical protein D9M71_759130 [compost metagenome]